MPLVEQIFGQKPKYGQIKNLTQRWRWMKLSDDPSRIYPLGTIGVCTRFYANSLKITNITMMPQKISGITKFENQDDCKKCYANSSCGCYDNSQDEKTLTCW